MEDSTVDSKSNYAPHLALLAVQFMFGTFPVVGKIALQSFPSFGIVAFRVGGAALAFLALQRFAGTLWLARRRDYLWMFVYALFGIIFNQLLSVTGLSLTTATHSALLAIMMPIFIPIISAVFGFEKLNLIKSAGIVIAASGVIYLINPTNGDFSLKNISGDLMVIANGFCYAFYLAISKDVISRNGAIRSLAWLFLFGSIVCVPLGIFSLSAVDFSSVSTKVWLDLAFIVLFPTIGAYYLNAWALTRVAPSVVAVYIYLQPLVGTFLAIFVLGEDWKPRIFLAMALIFTGVFLVTKKQKQEIISKLQIKNGVET
jgi:drug/metabolite transporter (DMT)-like permease